MLGTSQTWSSLRLKVTTLVATLVATLVTAYNLRFFDLSPFLPVVNPK